MHRTAIMNCKSFFDTYSKSFEGNKNIKIVEIGSQDVNGSLRITAPNEFEYIGVDFVKGNGVDIVLSDPYSLPFKSESIDIILTSSCFEHSEMFWLVFLEIMRVLKPKGLCYLNAPSNGNIHRYPVDCWRFYPDSGQALITWVKRNGINAVQLESYTSAQTDGLDGLWNDFIAIFLKDENHIFEFPNRILDKKNDVFNGLIYGSNTFINPSELPEDKLKLANMPKILKTYTQIHNSKNGKVSDKWESYLGFYDDLFKKQRNDRLSILEIGIQNGGSLETYAEYFHNHEILIGCDINEDCKKLRFNSDKIKVIVGDANSEITYNKISKIKNSFDFIIDDGSHISVDILNSFIRYFPMVNPGGFYLIEDTHTLYNKKFGGGLLNELSAYNFFKKLIDIINFQWWDNSIEIDAYLSTFLPKKVPNFILEGWIDSIEFRNSIITIKKAKKPGHDKLGERTIKGTEAIVVDLRNIDGKSRGAF
jgi:SAM-dependent methyltransferase